MSGPSALCSAGAPNDWRRTLVRVKSFSVLTPYAPSALAPDGAGHLARRAVALAKPLASNSCPMKNHHGKRKRCNAPQGRPAVAAHAARPRSASPACIRQDTGGAVRRVSANKSNPASHFALCRPGGHGGVTPPVPIPNTAVKNPCANGTASKDAGE